MKEQYNNCYGDLADGAGHRETDLLRNAKYGGSLYDEAIQDVTLLHAARPAAVEHGKVDGQIIAERLAEYGLPSDAGMRSRAGSTSSRWRSTRAAPTAASCRRRPGGSRRGRRGGLGERSSPATRSSEPARNSSAPGSTWSSSTGRHLLRRHRPRLHRRHRDGGRRELPENPHLIVGDTPTDDVAAAAAGIPFIGVATDIFSVARLRQQARSWRCLDLDSGWARRPARRAEHRPDGGGVAPAMSAPGRCTPSSSPPTARAAPGSAASAPAFAPSADFALDKPAGSPARTCATTSAAASTRTCGSAASPAAPSSTASAPASTSRRAPSAAATGGPIRRRRAANVRRFPVMRPLHELLWYLTEALRPAAGALHGELEAFRDPVELLTAAPPSVSWPPTCRPPARRGRRAEPRKRTRPCRPRRRAGGSTAGPAPTSRRGPDRRDLRRGRPARRPARRRGPPRRGPPLVRPDRRRPAGRRPARGGPVHRALPHRTAAGVGIRRPAHAHPGSGWPARRTGASRSALARRGRNVLAAGDTTGAPRRFPPRRASAHSARRVQCGEEPLGVAAKLRDAQGRYRGVELRPCGRRDRTDGEPHRSAPLLRHAPQGLERAGLPCRLP